MSGFKKIAVTVPSDTFNAVEHARAKLGRSRSEVVAFALKEWLRSLEAGAARERYIAGYLRLPETAEDVETTLRVAAAATADWSAWGEPRRKKR